MHPADIGLIGLAIMGQNLVLNMNDHDFTVAVFNRTTSKVDDFMAGPAKGTNVIGAHTHERIDRPQNEFFHTDWTGQGGKVSSSTYNV